MKPSRALLGRLSGVLAACLLSVVVACGSSGSGGTGGTGTGGNKTGGAGGGGQGGAGATGGQSGGTAGHAEGGGGSNGGGQGGTAGHVADGGHGGVGGQAGAGNAGNGGNGGGGGKAGGNGGTGAGGQGGQGGGDVCSNPVEGAVCGQEGKSCGTCTSACQFCNRMICSSGHWSRQEAFPAPCFDCGSTQRCQQNVEYCRITEGGASGSSPGYACVAVPASCAKPPTCACLSSVPGQCTEISAGALSSTLQVP